MHFLLAPFGTAGDVFPHVGIGRELKRRRHRVTIITHSQFGDVVRRFGLEYVALDDDVEFTRLIDDPKHADPMAALKLEAKFILRDTMRKQFAAVAKLYEPGATAVVANHAGYGVRIAHDKLGIPMVSAYLSPFSIRSASRPAAQPVVHWPLWLTPFRFQRAAIFWIVDRFFADPALAPEINRFRAELGLAPVSRILERWMHSPQCILGLFPRWLAEPIPEDWPRVEFSEFPFFDDVEGPMPAEAEEFLNSGNPPVVFTPGTGGRHLQYFFDAAMAACRDLGIRALLLTRFAGQVSGALPPTVRHFPYLPLSRVLPRSAALVSHGGSGTMAQALRAGVPQIMMPMNYEQPENARRLKNLGVARVLSPKKFKGPVVARELERLLSDDGARWRCGGLARRMPAGEPCAAACDRLEEFALKHAKPVRLPVASH
jgi:rhamnosyltransferase subunit B